ncbi:MAG: magnesium transporter [Ignavibacteriaceae bacterium]|nr:magnesium transporter [Ignavibacteriaceae bacterium]MCW9097258.1 magnesium transporter [Ignavibacteriaceae bacterium]
MLSKLLMPEIESLIAERQLSILKEILSDWTPADIADLIIDLPAQDKVIVFRVLNVDLAADTFEHLEFETQEELLKAMGHEEVAAILNDMSPDDRTALFEELPGTSAKRLIQLLSADERKVAQTLLGYPENSVGRLMTPEYIAVKQDWTISETLDYIRKNGADSETLNVIYVINGKGVLIDDIRIREIILSSPDKKIIDLMDENFIALNVHNDQEKAVEVFKKYDRIALPVVDNSGVLIGIVTVDDVLDIAEEEATEDIQKLAAVQALEESYPSISIPVMLRKRGSWLALLFVGEMFTASAMALFENEISRAIVLTLFIPLIISSGGNSGSQAATLVIRALSLGEISIKDWFFVFKRELITGFALGVILAIIGFLRITVWEAASNVYGQYWFLIGITVSVSLIGVVLWGTISGSMLPLILKKLGLDPATSSAPLVATMVDVIGLIIYFTVAILVLSGSLL